MTRLQSNALSVESYEEGLDLFYEKGWTDGLPVVLPTRDNVTALLNFTGHAPDDVIGRVPERNRVLTAEKVAINAVMAGCTPEVFPVVVAAVRAVTQPEFEFNHLASMGSPTPVIIVSGEKARELGINSEGWLLGPGGRANASIGRALSLVLWNCAELRPSGVLRGTYGNPLRWVSGCVAESPDTPRGDTLREHLGYDYGDSTVTVISNCGTFTQPWIMKPDATDTLHTIADAIVGGSGNFNRGVYVLILAPSIVRRFTSQGWSLGDVREWLLNNSGRNLASLKRRGFPPAGEAHRLWASDPDATGDTFQAAVLRGEVPPGDDERFIHLFRSNGDLDELIWSQSQLSRETDIYIVTAGADVAYGCVVLSEYDVSTVPVTVKL